jgi:DNA-binding response OmpR family regulator
MPKTMLIIEDEPELAHLLMDVLRIGGGFHVVLSTGMSAATTMQELQPDAIVIDYVMPGVTGAEVLARLREQAPGSLPPVILVTGRDDAAALAADVGADAYLRKPFDVQELLDLAKALTTQG